MTHRLFVTVGCALLVAACAAGSAVDVTDEPASSTSGNEPAPSSNIPATSSSTTTSSGDAGSSKSASSSASSSSGSSTSSSSGGSSSGGSSSGGSSSGKSSTSSSSGGSSSGGSSSGGSCFGYADPSTFADCFACGSKPCQQNGCYNGYYCDLLQTKCVPKPPGC